PGAGAVDRVWREVRLDLVPFSEAGLSERVGTELALLRDDLNDAGGGVGAVQRRGRGTFDDLDALDVFRRDIVERRDALAAEGFQGLTLHADVLPLAAFHADAIDEDDRRIGQRDRRRAADRDAGRRAGRPRSLLHVDAGDATAQHFGERLHRRLRG